MSVLNITKLVNRKIVKIQGPDSYIYLQGLVSNDVRQLYQANFQKDERLASLSENSISAFMMNPLGRAICDMLIFRTSRTSKMFESKPAGQNKDYDELYIECDADVACSLARTLTAYRVKRKVSLSIENHLNIWSIYRPDTEILTVQNPESSTQIQSTSLLPEIAHDKETVSDKYILTCDPRLESLGLRILTPEHDFKVIKDELKLPGDCYKEVSLSKYVYHRYKLGVGEGNKDNLESVSLPLECNADYLRSVSFTKGCYLGQELTARIHHTGIVRKRIMPITLNQDVIGQGRVNLLPSSDIVNENDTNVGKIRNVLGDKGLALMRVEQTVRSKVLKHKQTGLTLKTSVPFWWPAQR